MNCEATTKSKKQCLGFAISGSRFCFVHDPKTEDERLEARSKGGRARKSQTLPETTPDASLSSPRDVSALLANTINEVRRGGLDAKTANTVGYLSGVLLKSMEYGLLEDEIRKLREEVNSLKVTG